MNLKGSKTEKNLKDAFAGESQANRRYLYFAAKADVEGYNDVSAVFRSTAEGETGHAHGHLEYLEAVGDPATGLPIGETANNLKAAIAGETHEYTDMYPGMAKAGARRGLHGNRRLVRDPRQSRTLARQSLPESTRRALIGRPLANRFMSNELPGGRREGSLEAPTRHPLGWEQPEFYQSAALEKELERVFDICHGCRRCFNLCNAFPTLFDAVDATATGEVAAVERKAFWKVVDHCYLCDMCYMTKCPYVPPHPWNVDFPHLMLRAKAVRTRKGAPARSRVSSTEAVGRIAGIPVVVEAVNAVNRSRSGRRLLQKHTRRARDAPVPKYYSHTFRRRDRKRVPGNARRPSTAAGDEWRVALFVTCYCNRNEPDIAADLVKVFEHNGIAVSAAAGRAVLRHAEARTRRPGGGSRLGRRMSRAHGARRRRSRYRRRRFRPASSCSSRNCR